MQESDGDRGSGEKKERNRWSDNINDDLSERELSFMYLAVCATYTEIFLSFVNAVWNFTVDAHAYIVQWLRLIFSSDCAFCDKSTKIRTLLALYIYIYIYIYINMKPGTHRYRHGNRPPS